MLNGNVSTRGHNNQGIRPRKERHHQTLETTSDYETRTCLSNSCQLMIHSHRLEHEVL